MRLDKLLANYGIGTRKEVKSLIIKKDDFKVDHEIDEIVFDDELIEYRPYVYIMLNKPAGYISATKDNLHPTVLELIEGYENYDLFPVGRLDLDTEGLLLITNDGDFSHKLLAPSRNHSKIYFANIAGVMDEQDIQAFKDGIILNTGYHCKPANLEINNKNNDSCDVRIEIFEGKFHQVKKMVEVCGKEVIYLKRLSIRNLELDRSLALGDFRELSNEELVDLMEDL